MAAPAALAAVAAVEAAAPLALVRGPLRDSFDLLVRGAHDQHAPGQGRPEVTGGMSPSAQRPVEPLVGPYAAEGFARGLAAASCPEHNNKRGRSYTAAKARQGDGIRGKHCLSAGNTYGERSISTA